MAQTISRPRAAGDPPHVIVVGAGMAGLTAAFELEQAGCTCTIVEAERSHVGGRVRTHRFSNGQYGELGAMRLPDTHKTVLDYVKKFGLTTRPFINSSPNAYFYLRGQRERYLRYDRIRQLYQLRPGEREKTLLQLWGLAVDPIIESLTEVERDDLANSDSWKTAKIDGLDQLSIHQVLERAGLSPEAIELVGVALGVGETLLEAAATEHLREELSALWAGDFHEIVGGMELLPNAFLRALTTKPRMGCEVVRLERDETTGRVAAICRLGDKTERVEGDYLVCTIPFSVLQRVAADPPFSGGKQRAIREITYESATKVLVNAKRRFWETDDAILGGASYTDLLTGPIFYPSDNRLGGDEDRSRGPGPLLICYNWGEAARRLGVLPASEREQLAVDLVSGLHPQLTAEPGLVADKVSWAWHTHRWSCGAFAFYLPGQFARLHRDVVAPEGRIHFAGEHTSRSHTWIEGAMESGHRAAGEIITRAGR